MPVIKSVDSGSPARRAGLRAGDELTAINGNIIRDRLDYDFYRSESVMAISARRGGRDMVFTVFKKDAYSPLGIDFETYLMDRPRSCRNRCVFCFIDQLPRGMRRELYFKDDDYRLSLIFGNYVTLANVSAEDMERIVRLRISPINISVHAMTPRVRAQMLGNPEVERNDVLDKIRTLAASGIEMNMQIVLCPDINDGEELIYTVDKLIGFYPAVHSVSVVPVGLTRYRGERGLAGLRPFTPEECGTVVSVIERMASAARTFCGSNVVYAADEFYLKAGRELPPIEYYEDLPQLENGVGMTASLRDEFERAVEGLTEREKGAKNVMSIATGAAAYDFICSLVDLLKQKCHNLDIRVYRIENKFFGPLITVSGLVTGRDLVDSLKGRELGRYVAIPSSMLRSTRDMFLDSMTVGQVERELGVELMPVDNDGDQLCAAMLGETDGDGDYDELEASL